MTIERDRLRVVDTLWAGWRSRYVRAADEWNEDYLDESVTWFGRRFKKAVRAKRVPEAAWLRKTDTNLNIYRRVA